MIAVAEIEAGFMGQNPSDRVGDGLIDSIRELGILEPLLVTRTETGRIGLVAGHRRLDAAIKLGFESVPCIVIGTDQMVQAHVAENVAREQLKPSQEADAFALMIESGMDVKEVAKFSGVSESYVRRRIRLLSLPAEIARYIDVGAMSLTVAEMVLSVDESLRLPFGRWCVGRDEQDGSTDIDSPGEFDPRSVSEVLHQLRYIYKRSLEHAPWRLGEPMEIPSYGTLIACTQCPQRSSAQLSLMADGEMEGDLCLDSSCFAMKLAEHNRRTIEEAKAKGAKVHEDRTMPAGYTSAQGLSAAAQGQIDVELWAPDGKTAIPIAKQAEVDRVYAKVLWSPTEIAEKKKLRERRKEEKKRAEMALTVVGRIADKFSEYAQPHVPAEAWQWMFEALLSQLSFDASNALAKLLHVEVEPYANARKVLADHVRKLPASSLRGAVAAAAFVEISTYRQLDWKKGEIMGMAKACGVSTEPPEKPKKTKAAPKVAPKKKTKATAKKKKGT